MPLTQLGPGRTVRALMATALVLAIGVPMAIGVPRAQSRTVTIGGPFALTALDGTTVTDQTYRGKWLLVYFGYTSCPDSCPTALADIAAALAALGPDAAKLQPLFITVDPQRDTPKTIAAYAAAFDPRIVGLSGSAAAIDAAMQAYGVYATSHNAIVGARVDLLDHSVYVYLMNPDGAYVRAFDPDWTGENIAAAVRQAMAAGGVRGASR